MAVNPVKLFDTVPTGNVPLENNPVAPLPAAPLVLTSNSYPTEGNVEGCAQLITEVDEVIGPLVRAVGAKQLGTIAAREILSTEAGGFTPPLPSFFQTKTKRLVFPETYAN